jgi:hypothetical protein
LFDFTILQLVAYDPNGFPFSTIWQPTFWGRILGSTEARKSIEKYKWEYERMGGMKE